LTTPLLTYRGTAGKDRLLVDLDRLMVTRMLIQANSGGGKSRALRQLLEETFGKVQHIVIDPEGEFPTLREKFPYVLAAKTGGDVLASPKTAKLLCRRLMELGASAILDIYELSVPERREFVRIFLTEMTALPKTLWRPCIVVIDESHAFAPEKGHGESVSTNAVIDFISLSRKRGFCPILATQRLSKLNKDAAAELNNKMIGRTGLDVDMDRAAKELGFDKDKRRTLAQLGDGEFYVFGPAISREVTIIKTGDVITSHPEPGQVSAAPIAAPAKVKAMLSQLVDLPKEAEEEAKSVADLQKQVKQLKGDLSRAQRGVDVADPADAQRQIVAAVEKARATWTRDLRRIVGKDLDVLAKSIDSVGHASDKLATFVANSRAAFLSLDRDVDLSYQSDREIAIASVPERSPVAASRPRTTPVAQRSTLPGSDYTIINDTLSNPQQRMLDALASFEAIGVNQLAKSHVAVFSDQSSRSSGFRNNLSVLSAKGLIERVDSETVRLTDDGRVAASPSAAPATLDELHEAWLKKLTGPQKLMLRLVLDDADGVERDDLAKNSGQSPLSSGYRNNLSVLSSLGLTKKESGMIKATALLYPKGL
jgi:hypothetical protein